MKLNINKACDLSSISVLPPQSRRLSTIPNGQQTSQLRLQQSQQSFSQGFSSQHGMFSQVSQSSFDDHLPNDQRFNSQEPENFVKRAPCFPPICLAREESHMSQSRSSTNTMHKWNPAPVLDHKCQINEELEHRLGMMETSLNKFGMVLGSLQSDITQAIKGTKEISAEMESARQKWVVLDSSVQLMIKGLEDTKASLDGSLKSVSERLSKDMFQDRLLAEHIFLLLSALPQQMEASLLKLQTDLCLTFAKELQTAACNEEISNQNCPSVTLLPEKVTGSRPHKKPKPSSNLVVSYKACEQPTTHPKIKMGTWNTVKTEKATFSQKTFQKEQKHKGVSSIHKARQSRVIIESDEEIDGFISCLIDRSETEIGNYTVDQATEGSERILRKARRRKRKHGSPIIIN